MQKNLPNRSNERYFRSFEKEIVGTEKEAFRGTLGMVEQELLAALKSS